MANPDVHKQIYYVSTREARLTGAHHVYFVVYPSSPVRPALGHDGVSDVYQDPLHLLLYEQKTIDKSAQQPTLGPTDVYDKRKLWLAWWG